MNTFRGARSLASLLVTAAAVYPAGASAADLYGAQGYTPMPVTSTAPAFYFRLDGGFAAYDNPAIYQAGARQAGDTDIDGSWGIGGGVGYYFTQNIRADVTVEHRFEADVESRKNGGASNSTGTFGLDTTLVMFNAYYDFDNRSFFTPYVGVGLGVANHSINDGAMTFRGGTGSIAGDETTSVAGALMAGFSVALLDNLKFDTGYRFLYLGEAESGPLTIRAAGAGTSTADKLSLEEIHAHEVRFGLRYDFR